MEINKLHIDPDKGAVWLVNKPLGWTSFDVVNKLRYTILKNLHKFYDPKPEGKRKIKVGHAGTLDPLATGLLIVCIGKQTKNIDQYMATEKEYTGSFYLGASTPSFDLETEVNHTFPISHLNDSLILDAAKSFLGEQQQIPPVFSAIKKDGKRLYESAREGLEVELKPRNIFIHAFEITQISLPIINFRIVCSKGTYIRSIANDFGKKLNSGAYLHSLCRTRSGEYVLGDAMSVETYTNLLNA